MSSITRSTERPSILAAAAKPPTKAASSAPSRRSRAGSSLICTSMSACGDALAQSRRAPHSPRRRRRHRHARRRRDRPRRSCRRRRHGRANPRRPRHRRRARCRRCDRAARWPAARRAAASGFSSSVSSRAATACTAASISAICAGKRSRNRPEMRQVTSTRARPADGGRQHFDAGDAAAGMVPDRPAAHQRQTLRDLLAAGAQGGAAPQIDDDRARHVAMRSADARARLRRRRGGRAPSRSASAACADRR